MDKQIRLRDAKGRFRKPTPIEFARHFPQRYYRKENAGRAILVFNNPPEKQCSTSGRDVILITLGIVALAALLLVFRYHNPSWLPKN